MYQFSVPDMTCGHCAGTITKAVKSRDPQAKVDIDLSQHVVKVESALPESVISAEIAEAGYTPTARAA